MMIVSATAVVIAFFIIFVLGLVKVFAPLFQERQRGQKVLHGIDGLQPHWLIGHLGKYQPTAKSYNFFCSLLKKYPKIGTLWIGPFMWFLTIHHPHVLPAILNTAEPKDTQGYGFLKDWIGDGLLVSNGKKWFRNRRLLTRAFHFDILKEYHIIFNKCAEELLNKWERDEQDKKIEIYEDITLMALDSLLQCIMSCETHCQTKNGRNSYVDAIFMLGQLVIKRAFNPLLHPDFIFYLTPTGRKFKFYCDLVHQFDEKMIEERKQFIYSTLKKCDGDSEAGNASNIEEYQRLSGKKLDFLDILLLTRDEDGKGLSDREVRDEVDTFLFEGHDTTASGISWALYCFAKYPDFQEKCRGEILSTIGQKKDIQGSDLSKLTYLSMFLKEVLRLYPPAPNMARKTTKPIHFPRGFGEDQFCTDKIPPPNSSRVIEASTRISTPIYMTHRNPSVFEDPEVFDPLRFSPERSKNRSAYAYIPFSAGPRNCIGKNFAVSEIKIVMCKALQRYRFYVDDDCPEPEIFPSVTLIAKDGIYVKMMPL